MADTVPLSWDEYNAMVNTSMMVDAAEIDTSQWLMSRGETNLTKVLKSLTVDELHAEFERHVNIAGIDWMFSFDVELELVSRLRAHEADARAELLAESKRIEELSENA